MLSIGLMSGTSMDGIDAALLKTDGKAAIAQIDNVFLPYPPELKILFKMIEYATRQSCGDLLLAQQVFSTRMTEYLQQILGLSVNQTVQKTKQLARFFHQQENQPITFTEIVQRSTELHAQAVNDLLQKTHLTADLIDVIGYHGQTLLHRPADKLSIQIGDGRLLAELTGITVINDFRSRDIAAGGEGAPFAPLYHQALAVNAGRVPAAVINCGGIANVSFITGAAPTDVIGFDTGPGNGLIDRCVKQFTQGREHMDLNGQYGSQGQVHENVISALYANAVNLKPDNFFSRKPPKSLDIGDLEYIPELLNLSLPDACRTLAAFTADSIVNALHTFIKVIPDSVILAGGGWNNPVIRSELENRLSSSISNTIQVVNADDIGWNSQAMEAQLFAYLAVRSLLKLPISLPATTRVPEPLSGGCLHLSPLGPTQEVAKIL
jgi:anhydro-N-acetylmuramic acid kinase